MDQRITLSVAFTLPELCRGLGGSSALFESTDELVAALDDRQVSALLRKLSVLWG